MKRGQPQCVLSVDISTCREVISPLERRWRRGRKGSQESGRGAWTGLEPGLDQCPENKPWIRRKRLLPQAPPRRHTFRRPLSPDISSNWRMGTSPT